MIRLQGTLSVIIGGLFVFIFVYSLISQIQLVIARNAAKRNPTEANAWRIYKILGRFGVGIQNHPKEWGKYRDMFYVVNGSPYVPTELKERLKARLTKKGLYINNMKIIDNYNRPF